MTKGALQRAFAAFDLDKTGQLTPAALLAILTRAGGGMAMTPEDARELVAMFAGASSVDSDQQQLPPSDKCKK